jgi:uncharacterized protein (DUF1330 family)
MNRHISIGMTMLAGIAIGAFAVQALHAQAKPKAYYVVEIEVLDAAANTAYGPKVQAAQAAAGAHGFGTAGRKIVGFEGTPPKSVAISEWGNVDQLQAYRNSQAFKDLAPQREKAVKRLRAYAVEGPTN